MKYVFHCRVCGDTDVNSRPAIIAPFVTEMIHGMSPQPTTCLYGLPNHCNYMPCRTLICAGCGFVGSNAMFDDAEMDRLYVDYRGSKYTACRRRYEPDYCPERYGVRMAYVDMCVVPFINAHTHGLETCIDYGGGDGVNTPNVCAQIEVYDVSNVASVYPATSSLHRCDIIVCMQVLEHVTDLHALLQSIRGHARYYYFEVPHEPHGHARELWHEHINSFTLGSFEKLLSMHFNVTSMTSQQIESGSIVQAMCVDQLPVPQ
jgi:hypothetical protein